MSLSSRLDPNETRNLWHEPNAQEDKQKMMALFAQAMLEAVEQGPWPKWLPRDELR